MPILFDVVSDLGTPYRVATVRALPGTLAGTWDPVTRGLWAPDLLAVREALPYIHRRAFDRAGSLWFSTALEIAPDGIANVDRAGAWGKGVHASMTLQDRRGRRIRGLRFRAYHSGTVTHADGSHDKRYSYDLENTGAASPQFVVRFCGDWVGAAANPAQAQAIAWRHALDRHAALNGAPAAYRFDYDRLSGTGILVRVADDLTSLRYTGEDAARLRDASAADLEAEAAGVEFS